jgi:hypothetical protein
MLYYEELHQQQSAEYVESNNKKEKVWFFVEKKIYIW